MVGRIYSLLPLLFFFEQFVLVVGEPRSWRVIDFYSFVLDLLQLFELLRGWHRRFEGLPLWEFVGLEVVSEEERCSVGHGDLASGFADSLYGSLGGIGALNCDGHAQPLESSSAGSENFHTLLDLGEDAGLQEVLESDWFIWVQHSFLDEVGDLAEVYLLVFKAIIESSGSETSLGESKLHLRLAAFETSGDRTTTSGIAALVTSSGGLTFAGALSTTKLLLTPPCARIIPERIRRNIEQ